MLTRYLPYSANHDFEHGRNAAPFAHEPERGIIEDRIYTAMRATPHSAPRLLHPLIIGLASVIALAGALPAEAGKRNPAPIDYRTYNPGQGQSSQRAQAPVPRRQYANRQTAPVQRAHRPADRASARIEFRYPDQPDVVYSNNGARRDAAAAPIAFSSAQAVISEQNAREYARQNAPANLMPNQAGFAGVAEGGFDARAEAARVAALRATTDIEEVALADMPTDMPGGVAFAPVANPSFDQTGLASWYGEDFHGQPTANGEIFDMNALTAAHPSLPLPSLVQVINPKNGREIVVRVNDRGPFEPGRMIEVSKRAAIELGIADQREANVRMRYLGPAPVAGQGASPQPQAISAPITPAPVGQYSDQSVAGEAPFMEPIPNPDTGYYVQVGSFSQISNAETLYHALGGSMQVEIVPVRVNGADYFRVMVGPLETRERAATIREHLFEQGIADGHIVEK